MICATPHGASAAHAAAPFLACGPCGSVAPVPTVSRVGATPAWRAWMPAHVHSLSTRTDFSFLLDYSSRSQTKALGRPAGRPVSTDPRAAHPIGLLQPYDEYEYTYCTAPALGSHAVDEFDRCPHAVRVMCELRRRLLIPLPFERSPQPSARVHCLPARRAGRCLGVCLRCSRT